ncbi:helicase/secretion neighborhood TadE-like protein [Lentzea albidocapillata subsp. violacea]|uniref:Helicase/secretion neighborhood TadE-like protein n=1 Tax=Lentzea albidocapillata subsp. violacea TaxID=128104 RepID=A0A1G9HKF2_9PSEU|nr:Rv3654c family TadE-like protein [Lentzea albidocapillata]SDL13352.1 helicase/secretion neighborhood TadE-like protein [Lentzea albidocapillata subsp. violacea]
MNGERFGCERGSAAVSGVVAMLSLIIVVVAGARIGSAVVARHRVTGAADLAALAAAARLVDGDESACEQAKRVASENRAELTSCAVNGWEVVVEVSATTPFGPARARARAGPAEDRAVWSTTSGRLTAVSGLTLPPGHAER